MHARLLLLGVFAVAGCTRDNPAFDDDTGTRGETSAATSMDTGPDSGEATTDPLACALDGGQPMTIELAPLCSPTNLDLYEQWFRVLGYDDDNTWSVGACSPGSCEDCAMFALSLRFPPVNVKSLAPVGSCLRVNALRQDPENDESCHYDTAVVYEYDEINNVGVPILIARSRPMTLFPVIDPALAVSGFQPALNWAEACDCSGDSDVCCTPEGPAPTEYDFVVGPPDMPEVVEIGGMTTLTFDDVDYEFWGLDAFDTGRCGEAQRVAWALTRK